MMMQRMTFGLVFGLAVSCVPARGDHQDPGDYSLLVEATVMPDFELDGRTFGNGQEELPVIRNGDIGTSAFASYSTGANNTAHLLVSLWGFAPVTTGDPIVAKNAIIVVTDFPPGTEFPNAHGFVDLDGDPTTPENPMYWYGTVKRTETDDDYRLIEVRRSNTDPFLMSYEVFGSLD